MKYLENILQFSKKILKTSLLGTALSLSLINFNSNKAYAEARPIYGFGHSPFRQDQSPETGVFPTEQQIREDLDIIKNSARAIRSYGNDNVLFKIPEICNEKSIDCYVGSWIYNDDSNENNHADEIWNQGVVDRLIEVSNENYPTSKALIVGNEFLLWRHFSAENILIPLINQTKSQTNLPVTTAETYNIWLEHPNVANAADFIGAHIHPYWEGVHIDNAVQHVLDKYNLLKQAYPNKEIMIFEVGWPSFGNTFGQAVPSQQNQEKFIKDFIYSAKLNNIKYFLFEAFDEPWKGKYNEVEKHWGLYDKDRVLKPELADFINSSPADINKDNNINILDLNEITRDWLKTTNLNGPCLLGDINQNGITDFNDFVVFSSQYQN